MPFDPAEWARANQKQIMVKLLTTDPLYIGLQKAKEEQNVSETVYIKTALGEKLQRDGYIDPDETIIIHGVGRRPWSNKK